MTGNYLIKIGSQGDTGGIDKVTGSLKKADQAADQFIDSIKAGIGIDIGGKIVNSLAAIPGVIQNAISRGIEFNMTMNNAEVGMTNVLGKFLDLDEAAAKRGAAQAMQQLIDLEPKAAGGLEDLVNGFMATGATALGMGLTVEQNIDLVGKFANALANSGKPIQQLGQEMRSILNGQATGDSDIATMLFGSPTAANEAIKQAKEVGNVYELIIEKMGKMGDAGDSAAVRMSTFQSAVSKALGQITAPVFDALIDGVLELTEALKDPTAVEGVRQLGFAVKGLVNNGIALTEWAIKNSDTLALLARGAAGLAIAFAAVKIKNIITGLGSMALGMGKSTLAIKAETTALNENALAQKADADARRSNTGGGPGGGKGGGKWSTSAAGVSAAASSGLVIGTAIQQAMLAYADRIDAKSADRQDIMSRMGKASNPAIEQVKNITSKSEYDAAFESLVAASKEITAIGAEATNPEDKKTASMTQDTIQKALNNLLAYSPEKLNDLKKVDDDRAAGEKAAEATQADDDRQKIIDSANQKRIDSARGRIAGEGIDSATGLAEKGNIAGAQAAFQKLQETYAGLLEATKAKQDGLSGDDLKGNLALQDELQSYVDAVEKARDELPDAIAKADQEAADKKIEGLEQERALIEAQGDLRLAQAEDDGAKRKQIEDEIAAKRLDIENQIGSLQGETDLQREARAVAYNAASIQRENQLANQTGSSTKSGDLFAGGNRRRGLFTSDAFEQNIPLNASALDAYAANRGNAIGSINGQGGLLPPSALPPDIATPGSLAGSPTPGQPGGSGKSGSGEKITTASEALQSAIEDLQDKTVSGLEKATAAVKSAGGKIGGTLSKHTAQIAALEANT